VKEFRQGLRGNIFTGAFLLLHGLLVLAMAIGLVSLDASAIAGMFWTLVIATTAGLVPLSGNARLDDLGEYLGFPIDAEGIDTIGGFVFTRLGYLPPSGTRLDVPQLAITVRRAGRKRIEEVLLEKTTGDGTQETPDQTSAAA